MTILCGPYRRRGSSRTDQCGFVLCLGTSNRIARVVDRTRKWVADQIAALELGIQTWQPWDRQLKRLRSEPICS
ncbi:MAG: hypothetical protein U0V70_03050 [Terriglobia bacterium]